MVYSPLTQSVTSHGERALFMSCMFNASNSVVGTAHYTYKRGISKEKELKNARKRTMFTHYCTYTYDLTTHFLQNCLRILLLITFTYSASTLKTKELYCVKQMIAYVGHQFNFKNSRLWSATLGDRFSDSKYTRLLIADSYECDRRTV